MKRMKTPNKKNNRFNIYTLWVAFLFVFTIQSTVQAQCIGNAVSVEYQTGVGNSSSARFAPDDNGAELHHTGDILVLNLTTGDLLLSGGSVNVHWRRTSNSNSIIRVNLSSDGVNWSTNTIVDYTNINPRNRWITQPIPLTINTRYISFESMDGHDLQVDAVSFNRPSPTISGTTPASRCGTGNVTLGATASAGTINWYAASSGGTSLGTGTSFTTPSISSTTTYYVDATSGGCTTASRTAVIATVNSIPTIISTTFGTRCTPGVMQVVAVASNTLATINWYTTPTGGTPLNSTTVSGTSTYTTPSLSSTTTYYVDATLNGCTTPTRTPVIAEIVPSMNLVAGGGATYCVGSTINLTSSGTNIFSQSWVGPNGFTSTLANPSIPNITAAANGTYTVTTTTKGTNLVINGDFEQGNVNFLSSYGYAGTGSAALWPEGLYTVVANPQSVHSNFSSCADHTPAPGTLQMVVNGATVANVNIWQQSVNVQPGTIYEYSYWVQSVHPTNPAQLQLFVNNVAVGNINTAIQATCQWSQFTATWISGGSNTALLELRNMNTIASGNDFALDDFEFRGVCTATATVNVIVIATPATPGTIAGNAIQCSSASPLTYSIAPVPTATSYTWTVPTGWVINAGQGTTSISVSSSPNSGSGNISVTATNACGTSAARTLLVSVNPPSIEVRGNNITIPGTGLNTPITVNNTDFGFLEAGNNTTKQFVIHNLNPCTLLLPGLITFTDVFLNGSPTALNFSITSPPAGSLAGGGNTPFVITFSSNATTPAGIYSAKVNIPYQNVGGVISNYVYNILIKVLAPITGGPGGVGVNLILWLKANKGLNLADASLVTRWVDGRNIDNAITEGSSPIFRDNAIRNLNFNPVVDFVPGQYLKGELGVAYSNREMFVVVIPETTIDAASSRMPIYSGEINKLEPLVTDDFTGLSYGNFTDRLAGQSEILTYSQGRVAAPFYHLFDNTASKTYPVKGGIINARSNRFEILPATVPKTFVTPTLMQLNYNALSIGSGTENSGVFADILNQPYWIGKNKGDGAANLNGRIAEILNYSERVPDSDRPKIETYLAIKYGITLGAAGVSQNYLNSSANIIWDVTKALPYTYNFNYDIAGIGYDYQSVLDQKQSKSINRTDDVTIGLGTIAATNNLNASVFEGDKSFLVWGSNNNNYTYSATTKSTSLNGVTTVLTPILRHWRIVETGGEVGEVIVSIPNAAFIGSLGSNEEYALVVFSNPQFNNADIIDVIPLRNVSGNLLTWYDFDGNNDNAKYFTFAKVARNGTSHQIDFNGTSTYLVGENGFHLNNVFTISAWIKSNISGSGNRTIMAKGTTTELKLNNNNKIEVSWDGSANFISNTAIEDGLWHHIALTFNEFGTLTIYIDGIYDKSGPAVAPANSTARFSIGATFVGKFSNTFNYFNGAIDEVRIWDSVLTLNQIRYVMNQELLEFTDNMVTGKVIPQGITLNEIKTIPWNKLKSYYNFNSYFGTTVEGNSIYKNFLRTNYLYSNKNAVNAQTAPLPYESFDNGEWSATGVWKNQSVQYLPNSVVTRNGVPTEITWNIVKTSHNIISNGNKTLLGLLVESNTLTASNDTKIEVSHYLKLNGVIDLQGRSQLVQTRNSDLDPTSGGSIRRNQQGTGNRFNYNYWSSPVGPVNNLTNNNIYKVDQVFKHGLDNLGVIGDGDAKYHKTTNGNITWIGGYDGNNLVTPIQLARYWITKYENGSLYANWLLINETTTILPSQGYTIKGGGAVGSDVQNYTFVGKPFNGPISGVEVLPNNYFLVGNPYASALDIHQFINDNVNSIYGAVYIWEQAPNNNTHIRANSKGAYYSLNILGSTPPIKPIAISDIGTVNKPPKQFLPVGQGFFVIGKDDVAGTKKPVVFNNGQRLFVKEDATDGLNPISTTLIRKGENTKNNKGLAATDHFYDNSNNTVKKEENFKIRLGFNTNDLVHRQLLIGFIDGKATGGIDHGYDAWQIDTQPNDLYFLIGTSRYNIQGVGKFDVNKTYPLGIRNAVAGKVQFMIDEVEFLPADIAIYIFDKETNIYHNITKQLVEITIPSGTNNIRFELAFKEDKTLSVEQEQEEKENKVRIYLNNSEEMIYIHNNSLSVIKEVAVYNMLGQRLIYQNKGFLGNTLQVPFKLSTGVYLVKVLTNIGIVNKKVIKD